MALQTAPTQHRPCQTHSVQRDKRRSGAHVLRFPLHFFPAPAPFSALLLPPAWGQRMDADISDYNGMVNSTGRALCAALDADASRPDREAYLFHHHGISNTAVDD